MQARQEAYLEETRCLRAIVAAAIARNTEWTRSDRALATARLARNTVFHLVFDGCVALLKACGLVSLRHRLGNVRRRVASNGWCKSRLT
jgi:hypothetical protein